MRAIAVVLLVLTHLALCQGWTCTEGPQLNNAVQVDAGLGEVVAVDKGGMFDRVDAGGDGFIVGIRHGANHVYCFRSEYTNTLTVKGYGQSRVTTMYYLSCGPLGCWGITRRGQVIFNGLKSATCTFTSWRIIGGGAFQVVHVGSEGRVFGVSSGKVLERIGITEGNPYGSSWQVVPLCKTMRQVAYDLGTIYGVSTDGAIMKCTA